MGSIVIDRMWEKRELMEKGDPRAEEIRIAAVGSPGANLGVYSAGAGIALHDLDLVRTILDGVGISTGAWVLGYIAGGPKQIRQGAEVYYKDFSGTQLFSWWPPKEFPMSKRTIYSATTTGERKFDMSAALVSPMRIFTGVTTLEGLGVLINIRAIKNPWDAFFASSANPLAYKEPWPIGNSRYWDGGIAMQCPVLEICRMLSPPPTDVLVFPNIPYIPKRNRRSEIKKFLFCKLTMPHVPAAVRRLISKMGERFASDIENIRHVRTLGINVHILWPPDCGINGFTTDAEALRNAVQASANHTLKEFGVFGKSVDISWNK